MLSRRGILSMFPLKLYFSIQNKNKLRLPELWIHNSSGVVWSSHFGRSHRMVDGRCERSRYASQVLVAEFRVDLAARKCGLEAMASILLERWRISNRHADLHCWFAKRKITQINKMRIQLTINLIIIKTSTEESENENKSYLYCFN